MYILIDIEDEDLRGKETNAPHALKRSGANPDVTGNAYYSFLGFLFLG
jgi:hypothetical protein